MCYCSTRNTGENRAWSKETSAAVFTDATLQGRRSLTGRHLAGAFRGWKLGAGITQGSIRRSQAGKTAWNNRRGSADSLDVAKQSGPQTYTEQGRDAARLTRTPLAHQDGFQSVVTTWSLASVPAHSSTILEWLWGA